MIPQKTPDQKITCYCPFSVCSLVPLLFSVSFPSPCSIFPSHFVAPCSLSRCLFHVSWSLCYCSVIFPITVPCSLGHSVTGCPCSQSCFYTHWPMFSVLFLFPIPVPCSPVSLLLSVPFPGLCSMYMFSGHFTVLSPISQFFCHAPNPNSTTLSQFFGFFPNSQSPALFYFVLFCHPVHKLIKGAISREELTTNSMYEYLYVSFSFLQPGPVAELLTPHQGGQFLINAVRGMKLCRYLEYPYIFLLGPF